MAKVKVYITAKVSKCIAEVDAESYSDYLDKGKLICDSYDNDNYSLSDFSFTSKPSMDELDEWIWESLNDNKNS